MISTKDGQYVHFKDSAVICFFNCKFPPNVLNVVKVDSFKLESLVLHWSSICPQFVHDLISLVDRSFLVRWMNVGHHVMCGSMVQSLIVCVVPKFTRMCKGPEKWYLFVRLNTKVTRKTCVNHQATHIHIDMKQETGYER